MHNQARITMIKQIKRKWKHWQYEDDVQLKKTYTRLMESKNTSLTEEHKIMRMMKKFTPAQKQMMLICAERISKGDIARPL